VAIVQFQRRRRLTEAAQAPTGTEMLSEAIADERCRFRTTQAGGNPAHHRGGRETHRTTLIAGKPAESAVGVLRADAECTNKTVSSPLAPDTLRFYLRALTEALQLYELISTNRFGRVAETVGDEQSFELSASAIRPEASNKPRR